MQLMQQTVLKGRDDGACAPAIASPNARYVLNVAIVYQDALTRQWAGQVRDLAARVIGPDAIRCTEWKIRDLVEPRAYWEGVVALAHADVIVVSLHETDRLPGTFYLWVNLWLQERSVRPGVLVALLVPLEVSNSGVSETRRYLAAVASQGQLELLMHDWGDPVHDLGAALRSLEVAPETGSPSTMTAEDSPIQTDQSDRLAA